MRAHSVQDPYNKDVVVRSITENTSVPVGSYHDPLFGYPTLGLGSYNQQVEYRNKRVRYEPPDILSFRNSRNGFMQPLYGPYPARRGRARRCRGCSGLGWDRSTFKPCRFEDAGTMAWVAVPSHELHTSVASLCCGPLFGTAVFKSVCRSELCRKSPSSVTDAVAKVPPGHVANPPCSHRSQARSMLTVMKSAATPSGHNT